MIIKLGRPFEIGGVTLVLEQNEDGNYDISQFVPLDHRLLQELHKSDEIDRVCRQVNLSTNRTPVVV